MGRLDNALAFCKAWPEYWCYSIHDADGAIVYVGSTQNPIERWLAHEQVASPYLVELRQWIDANPHTFAVVGSYDDKRAMLDAERAAIERIEPRFNRRYNDLPASWPMNKTRLSV